MPHGAGLLGLTLAMLATALPVHHEVSSYQDWRPTSAATGPATARFSSVPIGAGGFVTGISFSDDGATRVIRTDGFGGYRWAENRWELNVSADTLPAADVSPGSDNGVLAVAVAPSDASISYLAYQDNVYRSSDGAATWTRVLAGVTTVPNDNFRPWGSRLAVDPRDADVVLYGSQLDGLQITRDGGQTWTRVAETTVPAGMLVDIDDPAVRGSLDRPTTVSADGTRLAGGGVSAVAFDRSSGEVGSRTTVVYAASYGHGVYRSADAGLSWTKVSPRGVTAVRNLRVLSNGDVIATTRSNPTDLGGASEVWRQRGGRWERITLGKSATWGPVAEDPSRAGHLAMMGQGGVLALSTDYGESWTLPKRTQDSTHDVGWLSWALNGGDNFMTVGEIAFDPTTPGRLWLAEGTGVWFADVETPSATVLWHSQSRGIEQLVPTSTVVPPGGEPMLTAWDRPIFRAESLDSYPASYGPVNAFGSAWSIDWSAADPSYLVASVASHHAPYNPRTSGYSTDGGRTWQPFPTIPRSSVNAMKTFGFGAVAAGAPGNVIWVPSYGRRPEFTLDGGHTWRPIELPGVSDYTLVNNRAYYVNRQVIAADRVSIGTFYLYVRNSGVFRTVDGGTTWTRMSDNSGLRGIDLSWNVTIEAVPGRAGALFMTPGQLGGTTSQPFLRSDDAGITWTRVAGLTGVSAFGFGKALPGLTDPAIYAAGYLGGTYGIYRSTDDAQTWDLITTYPAGRTSRVVSIDADKDVAGRVYVAMVGSSLLYADTPTGEGTTIEPPITPVPTTPAPPPTTVTPVPGTATPTPPAQPADPAVPVGPTAAPASPPAPPGAIAAPTTWTTPRLTKRRLTAKLRVRRGAVLAGRTIEIQIRRRPDGPWARAQTTTTDAQGFASLNVRGAVPGWYRFTVSGSPTLAASTSRERRLGGAARAARTSSRGR